jgi:hypothetical protein
MASTALRSAIISRDQGIARAFSRTLPTLFKVTSFRLGSTELRGPEQPSCASIIGPDGATEGKLEP